MAIYTVHVPPVRGGAEEPDPLRFAFVKEGWCWPALFFALPWLLFRRMWLVAIGYLVVFGALAALDSRLGGPVTSLAVSAAVLFVVLEGNQLRRWTLRRRGYSMVGVVEGRNVEEAEIRYFTGAGSTAQAPLSAAPETAPAETASAPAGQPQPIVPANREPVQSLAPMTPPPPRGDRNEIVGLFPAPQGS
jgi:hypothetical protein